MSVIGIVAMSLVTVWLGMCVVAGYRRSNMLHAIVMAPLIVACALCLIWLFVAGWLAAFGVVT